MIFYRKIIFFIFIISYLLSLDNFRHVKNITSLINSTAIQNLNDERLLIATTGGIYTSDYNGLNLIDYTDNLEYANISTLIKDNENIWLGGGDGNIQILDSGLNLKSVIDYIPFDSIKEIIFYDDYVFAIASYENRDVIVQYSNDNNPHYLNYFSFDNFLIEANNNGNIWTGYGDDEIINVTTIYDIMIRYDMMYLGTNEGLLKADLSNYNNNLLLLLDWVLYEGNSQAVSLIDNYPITQDFGYTINPEDDYDYFGLSGWINDYNGTEFSAGINLFESAEEFGYNINPEEDIIRSFYMSSGDDFYILLFDKLLYCPNPSQFPTFEVMFSLPNDIYSSFTDIEIINNILYFTLENHGVLRVSIDDIDNYEYIVPNTLFSNKITALDIDSNKNIVGLGGHPNIAQGGFLIDNIVGDYDISNFYSDGDNYEDLDQDGFYETYKYKYPSALLDLYKGKIIPYISGDKNSSSIKFDSSGNFYFINNGIYLEPDQYHPYNPYHPIKDEIGYPKGLLHINSFDFSIIDSWDSIFTGIRYVSNGYNYVSLSQMNIDSQNNLWIVNPYSEGDINKPMIVSNNDSWIDIEDNSDILYFLPEEIAFDNNNNIWVAYQKDDNQNYSPGGIRMLRLNESLDNENYTWWNSPLSIVEESACYQYNYDLPLNNVSVWSIDIGSDRYGNTILWTLSDYGVMGYVINYSYSGYFNSLSLNIEPINCNFYFSDIAFNESSRIRVDNQNNAWITSNSGLRMIKSDGILGYEGEVINSNNTQLFSDNIYDIVFDDYGYFYFATDLGISIFESTFAKEQSISNIAVSPNPFLIGNDMHLTISNLSSNSVIQIMTLSGKVVQEFVLNQETGIIGWDGRDKSGLFLSTGIYLVAAINTLNQTTGVTKLAVIRN